MAPVRPCNRARPGRSHGAALTGPAEPLCRADHRPTVDAWTTSRGASLPLVTPGAHHARTGWRAAVRHPSRVTGLREKRSRGWRGSASTTTRASNVGTSPARPTASSTRSHSALCLDRAEHDHLHDLARARTPARRGRAEGRPARHGSPRRCSTCSTRSPTRPRSSATTAWTSSRRTRSIRAVLRHVPGSARPANHSRFIFLDPRSGDFYHDWDRAANVNVAILRRDAGRFPPRPRDRRARR